MQTTSLPPLAMLPFGILWLLGVVGGLYFWFGSSADDKRQLYPWFTGLLLVGTLGAAYLVVRPPLLFFGLFAIAGSLSAVFHVRSTKFCPHCGRMIYRGLLSSVNYCPRCGQPLDHPHTPSRLLR